jgi:cellulose synthase/poly-beta-1,6-N-acetylglucosamine synthase-like glycosyltransferase
VTGAIYAMRRELWTPLPPDLILDDLYVPMRLVLDGWRVGFTDRARAVDARRFAPRQEYRRKVRTLTGVIQLCAWAPRVLNPFRNPVWIQFVCHKLLRLLTPYLVAVVAIAAVWQVGQRIVFAESKAPAIGVGVIVLAALAVPRVRRAFATQIVWGVAIQASIVVATFNGLRGRWDVWRS